MLVNATCGKGVVCVKEAGRSDWLSRHTPGLRCELVQAYEMCALSAEGVFAREQRAV